MPFCAIAHGGANDGARRRQSPDQMTTDKTGSAEHGHYVTSHVFRSPIRDGTHLMLAAPRQPWPGRVVALSLKPYNALAISVNRGDTVDG